MVTNALICTIIGSTRIDHLTQHYRTKKLKKKKKKVERKKHRRFAKRLNKIQYQSKKKRGRGKEKRENTEDRKPSQSR